MVERYLTPKEAIPRRVYAVASSLGFVGVLAIWAALSYGGVVKPLFLPTPTSVLRSFWTMLTEAGFAHDIWASTYRILAGFAISAVIGVPLGILIGSFKLFEAVFEPLIDAIRYMPASAFIPLFILWIGIGDREMIAVIIFGSFFPLVLLIADISANVPKDLLNIAYTLGASRWQVFYKVLLPASLPGIVDSLRVIIGWAWTYLIVAELVAANTGIGHVILQSQRYVETPRIIAGILTIGALGLVTDNLFKVLYRWLFPYAEKVHA
ncbi:MAG: ABC transporter permease [Thermomicrobiaceae bacterium]|nr:ABC transporter permease [Thermomicrobiaceae bacterium]